MINPALPPDWKAGVLIVLPSRQQDADSPLTAEGDAPSKSEAFQA